VGLLLCAGKDEEKVHTATANLPHAVFVSRYLIRPEVEEDRPQNLDILDRASYISKRGKDAVAPKVSPHRTGEQLVGRFKKCTDADERLRWQAVMLKAEAEVPKTSPLSVSGGRTGSAGGCEPTTKGAPRRFSPSSPRP